MASDNRLSVYFDAHDESSPVIKKIEDSVNKLQDTMEKTNTKSVGKNIGKDLKEANKETDLLLKNFVKMAGAVGVAYAAIQGIGAAVSGVFSFFQKGIELRVESDNAKNGIAGIIASVYKLKQDGKELTGLDKFNQSLVYADDAMKRLRVSAILTGASSKELIEGFQSALAPGGAIGLNIAQIEKISTLVANAGKSMKMDGNQVGQELRALLTGEIDANAQIGKSLDLKGNKEYTDALKKGGDEAFNFLIAKLAQFENAGKKSAQNMGGLFDTIKDSWDLFQENSTSGLEKQLLKIAPIVDGLFNVKELKFTKDIDAVSKSINEFGEVIGKNILGAVEKVVGWFSQIGNYLSADQTLLNGFSVILDQIFGLVGQIVNFFVEIGGLIVSIVSFFVNGISYISDWNNGLETTDQKTKGVATVLEIIVGFIGAIKIGFALVSDLVGEVGKAVDLLSSHFNSLVLYFTKFRAQLSFFSDEDKNIKNIQTQLDNLAKSRKDIVFGDFERTKKEMLKVADELQKATEKNNKLFGTPPVAPGGTTTGGTIQGTKGNKDEDKKGQRAAEAEAKKINDLKLKFYNQDFEAFKKVNDLTLKENDFLYKERLISLDKFYDEKSRIEDENFKKELEKLDNQINEINNQLAKSKKGSDTLSLELELNKLISSRNIAERENALIVKQRVADKEKENKLLLNEGKGLQADFLSLIGNDQESKKIKLDIDMENLKEKFKGLNYDDLIEKFEKVQNFYLKFDSQIDTLNTKEEMLNLKREGYAISQTEYSQSLQKLNSERLVLLQQELDMLRALSPSEETNKNIDMILAKMETLKNKNQEVMNGFKDVARNSLQGFFESIISGTTSLKDAFKNALDNIASYIDKFVSNAIIDRLMGSLKNVGGSGGGSGFFGGLLESFGSLIGMTPAKAVGGGVNAGQMQLVGENGKELFIPKTSGFILNATKTSDFINGSGGGNYGRGGNNITNNINIQTPDKSSMVNSEGQIATYFTNIVNKGTKNL